MVLAGPAPPMPYHQLRPVRQDVTVPRLELNWATSSGVDVSRSEPARALARALGYQVLTRGALGKLAKKSSAPAAPKTPDVGEQVSGSISAATVMGTAEDSRLLQYAAAAMKTLRRCCPRVVPALPGTGATGVGSLNPTPAPLPLTMVMLTAPPGPAASR